MADVGVLCEYWHCDRIPISLLRPTAMLTMTMTQAVCWRCSQLLHSPAPAPSAASWCHRIVLDPNYRFHMNVSFIFFLLWFVRVAVVLATFSSFHFSVVLRSPHSRTLFYASIIIILCISIVVYTIYTHHGSFSFPFVIVCRIYSLDLYITAAAAAAAVVVMVVVAETPFDTTIQKQPELPISYMLDWMHRWYGNVCVSLGFFLLSIIVVQVDRMLRL